MKRRDTKFGTVAQAQEKFEDAEQRFGKEYTVIDDESSKTYNSAGQAVSESSTELTVRGIVQFDPDNALKQDKQGVEEDGMAVFFTNDDRVDPGMRLVEDNGDEWRIEARTQRHRLRDGAVIYRRFRIRRADNES